MKALRLLSQVPCSCNAKLWSTLHLSCLVILTPTFKRLQKVSLSYFSVMYSARNLEDLGCFFLPSLLVCVSCWCLHVCVFHTSVCACVWMCVSDICKMPVGWSHERSWALIRHKQGHRTTPQPVVWSLLKNLPSISASTSQAHHSQSTRFSSWITN